MSEGSESNADARKPLKDIVRDLALPGVIVLAAAGLGAASIVNGLAARDQAATPPGPVVTVSPSPILCEPAGRASLVPVEGALFGVNLDWHNRPLADYARDLGRRPAVSVSFTGFPYTAAEKADLQDAVQQIKADGHIMLLTLEPMNGLGSVTAESSAALAKDLADFNGQGVPVIVRFAHEMNGSWYPWGQQPAQYIAAFRTMADAVHRDAPGSAMMWAPNYGGGYPFAGGQFEAKPGTADLQALDTDGDGTLSMADDSYGPYYPGDDAVDWVGMSLYHWGARYPWGENEIPEPNKFVDQLTGNYAGANGDDTLLSDFYAIYGQDHGKPVAIPETAALFAPDTAGAAEMEIKQAWWEQLFAPGIPAQFPQLKMINWFEWDKTEVEVKGRVDWAVTRTPETRSAFTTALPEWLHFATEESCG